MNLIHTGDLRHSTLLFHVTKRLLYTKWRDPGEEPKLHKAAADKPLKTLSIICSHAVDRNVLVGNPMTRVRRFDRPLALVQVELP